MDKKQKYHFRFLCILIFLLAALPCLTLAEKSPLTIAESSNFTATSLCADVIDFVRDLQDQSSLIRIETLCISSEGRKVPLLIIGNPAPFSPLDLKHDTRAVIYIQANIHAGEVEGKEASLMLAREILQTSKLPYLEHLVILIAPIFNADGNEKINPSNRRNQNGPEKGVGVRYNGQNLDLNRDSMKLESPELRGLVHNVLLRWDPVLLVDCHTTNGSYHEEPVTYSWPLNPSGDISIIEYMREIMLPSINKNLREKYNTLSIPYGNFSDFRNPEKGWQTFGHQPRYVTNYIGLRNRLAILNENYSYADYKTRVLGCYNFLLSILDYCSSHKEEILQLVSNADSKTIQQALSPSEENTFVIESDLKPLKNPVEILGWEMESVQQEGRRPLLKKTNKKMKYSIPYYSDFSPKRTVQFPFAYLITVPDPEIAAKLQQHGIVIEKLTKPASLEVESFRIKEIKAEERIYQGHRLNTVQGEYAKEKNVFSEGTFFIGTAQPLGRLAAYLLEPESDDGMLVWNFFDRYLVSQWSRAAQTYPVYRLLKPQDLVKETVPSEY